LPIKIDYIYKYIDNIDLPIDKIYKVGIILLEIRQKTLIFIEEVLKKVELFGKEF
jgi:hypothetical protein